MSDFLKKSKSEVKHAIFRHDVDKNPSNSLKMAHLENKLGIKAKKEMLPMQPGELI